MKDERYLGVCHAHVCRDELLDTQACASAALQDLFHPGSDEVRVQSRERDNENQNQQPRKDDHAQSPIAKRGLGDGVIVSVTSEKQR